MARSDRDPPSDPFRRDSSVELEKILEPVFERQREIIREETDERARRNRERAKFSTDQLRATREMESRLGKLEDRVSDLYTKDAVDVNSLDKLASDIKDLKTFLHTKVDAIEDQVDGIVKEKKEVAGMLKVIKFLWPIAGVFAGVVYWLMQQIKK